MGYAGGAGLQGCAAMARSSASYKDSAGACLGPRLQERWLRRSNQGLRPQMAPRGQRQGKAGTGHAARIFGSIELAIYGGRRRYDPVDIEVPAKASKGDRSIQREC